jgi:hypothetical protein
MLTDMKRAKGESPEVAVANPDSDPYPYGLRISLDKESLAKLGIDPEVGAEMQMIARVVVVSKHESEHEGEEERCSCELQITHMELATAQQDIATRLYGKG